jgi:hypothetical protein
MSAATAAAGLDSDSDAGRPGIAGARRAAAARAVTARKLETGPGTVTVTVARLPVARRNHESSFALGSEVRVTALVTARVNTHHIQFESVGLVTRTLEPTRLGKTVKLEA